MGYDLHITRKHMWSETDGPVISEEEWWKLVGSDPELYRDEECYWETVDHRYVAVGWNKHQGALCWYDGEVSAKNPDEALIGKMVRIAIQLSATVKGDDGETYREDATCFYEESTDADYAFALFGEPWEEYAVLFDPEALRTAIGKKSLDLFGDDEEISRLQDDGIVMGIQGYPPRLLLYLDKPIQEAWAALIKPLRGAVTFRAPKSILRFRVPSGQLCFGRATESISVEMKVDQSVRIPPGDYAASFYEVELTPAYIRDRKRASVGDRRYFLVADRNLPAMAAIPIVMINTYRIADESNGQIPWLLVAAFALLYFVAIAIARSSFYRTARERLIHALDGTPEHIAIFKTLHET